MANDKKTGNWLHEVDEADSMEYTQQVEWLENSQDAIDDNQDAQHNS